jgi:hypothetical protein
MPRPITKLTDEQEKLLAAAVAAAEKKHQAQQQANELEAVAWQAILEARNAGVPDEPLCDKTGFSRATLNRRYGTRRDAAE